MIIQLKEDVIVAILNLKKNSNLDIIKGPAQKKNVSSNSLSYKKIYIRFKMCCYKGIKDCKAAVQFKSQCNGC